MADSSKPGHGGDGSQSARLAQQRFAGQDTTPSATIALGGGDDSSDRDTDENEGSVTSSASRAAALKRKKVRRASLHIVSFIRVNVQASPTVNFSVTVDSSRTVEYLASLIEAEYAFRFTHLAQRFPPDQAARDNPNGVVTEPLVVGFLCDTQGRELNFQSPISAVLNLGDIVTVSHGAEEGEITQMMSHVTEDLDDIVTDSSGQGLESRFDLYSPQSVVSPGILDSTSDNRFTALLRNMAGITLFREFCQVELQLEALLFWMEVEIFTSTTPELRWLMAKYIYFMYIVDNAPLIINVPEDIRTDITASLGSQSDVQIFDEAQLHVYCLLKKQVFPKFEKTDKFKDFLRFRMTNPQAYFSAKIRNKYADNFKPNLELMLEICGGAGFAFHGLTPVHVKEKFLSRVIKRYFPSAAGVDGYWTQVAHVATAQRVRKVQKEKKLTKFFGVERDSKDRAQLRDEMVRQMARVDGDGGGATEGTGPGSRSSSNMDLTRELLLPAENDSGGGSEDGMNVDATTDDAASVDDLYARKRRADKLVEFFGKSVQRELGAAGVTQTGLPSVSNGDGGALPHSSGGYLGGAQAGQRPSRRGSTNDHTTITAGVVSAMTAMVGGGTAASDRASGGEIKTMVSTMNELPSETKAMLTRRSKKLRYVLGEALDENMAYDALLREVFAAPDRDRRVSSGGVKPIRASGTATSGVASLTDDVGEEGEEVDPFDDDDALTFQEEDDDVFLSDDDGDDAHSFATTSTHERKNAHLSKVRRRGKLEQLLGEGKIPTAAQGTPAPVIVLPSTTPARPATHEEQVKRRQRATKLEKVFGAPLPIEALTDVQRRTLEHRRSIVSVSRMLADSSALSSVLEHLAHASSPSGPSFLAPTLGESGGSAAASSGSGTFESPAVLSGEDTDEEQLETRDRTRRKRKFNKLAKFFGGNLDPAVLLEQSIIKTLEEEIQADMRNLGSDEQSMELLRADLAALREQVKEVARTMVDPNATMPSSVVPAQLIATSAALAAVPADLAAPIAAAAGTAATARRVSQRRALSVPPVAAMSASSSTSPRMPPTRTAGTTDSNDDDDLFVDASAESRRASKMSQSGGAGGGGGSTHGASGRPAASDSSVRPLMSGASTSSNNFASPS